LRLTYTTAFNSDITNNATLDLNRTTGTWTLNKVISGTGNVNKVGAGTVVLGGINSYSGITSIEQGVLSVSASANLGDGSATNTIRIANGATLQSTGANVDLGANRSIVLSGVGGTIEVTSTNKLVVSGLVTGNDCQLLTKTGTGTLSLTGGNTYAGGTQVSTGILDVSNTTGSGTGSGRVNVDVGAMLAGSGSIAPTAGNNVVINGTLAPGAVGATSGTDLAINITGSGTLTLNGAVNFTLFGNNNTGTLNPLTQNSHLIVGAADWNNIILGAGAVLNVGLNTGVTTTGWTTGDAFKLFDWTSILAGTSPAASAFSAINLPTLDSGRAWDTSGLFTTGTIVVVPEPGRAILLLIGLLGFCLRRRRN
jgi:autotransporter-associated beta strand protein